jgi:hypothetical protein
VTLDRFFYGYMALIGIAAGAILVTVPGADGFWLKPYFWILIAVGLFDLGSFPSGQMLTMNARIIGFVIGAMLMFILPMATGASVHFF